MVSIDGQRPRAPRTEALRMVGEHLVPIAAIGLAADDATAQLCRALYKASPTRRRYIAKTRGVITAAMWSEGVREWFLETAPDGLRLFEPFGWTELVAHDAVHVRIERETQWRRWAASDRRKRRVQQYEDDMLPLEWRSPEFKYTNLDITAGLNYRDRIAHVRAQARLGKSHLWEPEPIDLDAANLRLQAWRAEQAPWLATVTRALFLADIDGIGDRAERHAATLAAQLEEERWKNDTLRADLNRFTSAALPPEEATRRQFRQHPDAANAPAEDTGNDTA